MSPKAVLVPGAEFGQHPRAAQTLAHGSPSGAKAISPGLFLGTTLRCKITPSSRHVPASKLRSQQYDQIQVGVTL